MDWFNKKEMTQELYSDILGICSSWYYNENTLVTEDSDIHHSRVMLISRFNLLNTNSPLFNAAFSIEALDNSFARLLQMHMTITSRIGMHQFSKIKKDLIKSLNELSDFLVVNESYESIEQLINSHPYLVWIPVLNLIAIKKD